MSNFEVCAERDDSETCPEGQVQILRTRDEKARSDESGRENRERAKSRKLMEGGKGQCDRFVQQAKYRMERERQQTKPGASRKVRNESKAVERRGRRGRRRREQSGHRNATNLRKTPPLDTPASRTQSKTRQAAWDGGCGEGQGNERRRPGRSWRRPAGGKRRRGQSQIDNFKGRTAG